VFFSVGINLPLQREYITTGHSWLKYSLYTLYRYFIDYELSEDADRRFVVNPDHGIVAIRSGLDRETKPTYNIHILAIDKGMVLFGHDLWEIILVSI